MLLPFPAVSTSRREAEITESRRVLLFLGMTCQADIFESLMHVFNSSDVFSVLSAVCPREELKVLEISGSAEMFQSQPSVTVLEHFPLLH